MGIADSGPVLSRILDAAQTCRTAGEYHANLLEELRRWLGCDGGLMRPGARWVGSEPEYLDHDTRFTDAYVEHPAHYGHGLDRWCALSRGSQAFVDGEIHSASMQSRLPIYAEVLRPSGITSILASPLAFRGEVVGLIMLVRRGGAAPFSPEAREALSRLIPSIALGEFTIARTFEPARASRDTGASGKAFQSLGAREQQVARQIAAGLQSKEIAVLLGTSPNTIRVQTQRIFQKLGMSSRTHLALWMNEEGLAAAPVRAPAKIRLS